MTYSSTHCSLFWISLLLQCILKGNQGNKDTTNKFAKLKILFPKTKIGQKAIPFVGYIIRWNSLPELIKTTDNLNTFKYDVKNYYLNWINNELMKWISHCYYFKDLTIMTLYIFIFWIYLSIFFHLSLMFSSLSRETTMKIRHFCPFCAIPAISIAVYISVKISNF